MTAFVAVGARAQSASATTLTPTKPTITSPGGVLLAVLTTKSTSVHGTATPNWTRVGEQIQASAGFSASLWIAPDSAAAPVFTWTGAVASSAQLSYYSSAVGPVEAAIATLALNSGTGITHSSASITSTRTNALAVYVDVAAANTALATPTTWTENSDQGSSTDAGRTVWGSKALSSVGSTSGDISVTGANAPWVQWQVELRPAVGDGLEGSKFETSAWYEPGTGASISKAETSAWYEPDTGVAVSNIEVGAWLENPSEVNVSIIESGAWLVREPEEIEVSLMETGAWLDKEPEGIEISIIESGIWLDKIPAPRKKVPISLALIIGSTYPFECILESDSS